MTKSLPSSLAQHENRDVTTAAHLARDGRRTPMMSLPRSTAEQLAFDRLGHIIINPADRSVHTLLASYVFAGEEAHAINHSTATVDAFADQLYTAATGAMVSGRRTFLLEGERGCGKSCFINYLLARTHTRIAEEQIVFVRIDMSRDVPENYTIVRRLRTKLAKLLFRYFNRLGFVDALSENNKRIDVPSELLQLAEEGRRDGFLVGPLRPVQDEINALQLRYARGPDDIRLGSPLGPHAVSLELQELCVLLANRHGYSLLGVLDGLDRIEATPRADKLHKVHCNDLGQLSVVANSPWTLLAVCRPSSVNEVLANHTRAFPQERRFELGAPPLEAIVSSRCDAIRDELGEILDEAAYFAWKERFDQFQSELEEGRAREISTRLFAVGVAVPPDEPPLGSRNRRFQMQSIQLDYLHHLEGSSAAYRLIESLVLAGRVLAPRYFRYEYSRPDSKSVRWKRELVDPIPTDHRFLPCLFRTPMCAIEDPEIRKRDWAIAEPPLLALRILQLAEAHRELNGGRFSPRDALRSEDLVRILSQIGADRTATLVMIEELAEFEMLSLTGGINEFASSNSRYHVASLPRAVSALSYVVLELAYLAIAATEMPLPRETLEENPPLIVALHAKPQLSARTPEDWEFAREWISAKILNAVSIVRLCKHFNRTQRKQLDRSLGSLSSLQRDLVACAIDRGMFTFHQAMRAAISHQATLALQGLAEIGEGSGRNDPTGSELFTRRLNAYAEQWS